MTRHLLRLIWNAAAEIPADGRDLLLVLTLFGVVLVAALYAHNARQPLGYASNASGTSTSIARSRQGSVVKARHRETFSAADARLSGDAGTRGGGRGRHSRTATRAGQRIRLPADERSVTG